MNAAVQFLIVGGLSLGAAGATYVVKGPPVRNLVCDPATLKPDEVCLFQVTEPVLWIDARPRKQWEANGLPGSILWNLDSTEDSQAFEALAVEKMLETPRVVVYCSTEQCGVSRQVAEQVAALGVATEVKVLRGGWDALKDAGRVRDSSAAR